MPGKNKQEVTEMTKYVVMATWYGVEDAYLEEYSGIRHDTREEARKELIKAKEDINYDNFTIKEITK